MPAQAITSLLVDNEKQPKSREQAARETLGDLEILELIRYGTATYTHLLETDLSKVPGGKSISIDHEKGSLERLEKAVTGIGKLPKRKDYGGFDNNRGDKRSGAVIFGEVPQFGFSETGQLKLKVSKVNHAVYEATTKTHQPEEMFFDTQIAYQVDVTSGMVGLNAKRQEYTMDHTGIQIDLDKDGMVLALRGLQVNGETNLTTEDLPYNDKMTFTDLIGNLKTISN